MEDREGVCGEMGISVLLDRSGKFLIYELSGNIIMSGQSPSFSIVLLVTKCLKKCSVKVVRIE